MGAFTVVTLATTSKCWQGSHTPWGVAAYLAFACGAGLVAWEYVAIRRIERSRGAQGLDEDYAKAVTSKQEFLTIPDFGACGHAHAPTCRPRQASFA